MRDRFNDRYARCYPELLRRAVWIRRGDPDTGLGPSSLVHLAWLRLQGRRDVTDASTTHFKLIAAKAMKDVRIDHWRARNARKRQRPAAETPEAGCSPEQRRDLCEAIVELEAARPRPALVIKLSAEGLTIAQIAGRLRVSTSAIERDLRFARAWLRDRLTTNHRARER